MSRSIHYAINTRHRRRISWLLTAAVVASFFTAIEVTASAPSHAATLTVPSVPAQQPSLTMGCGAGKIDLNHASLAALQMLPGVSAPIAQRITAQRPHDRTQDLLAVPGIGADTLAAINTSDLACSTPLTIPPPSTDACTTPTQLDVNDPQSQTRLAALFGLPTAQRIVAAEPYPDLAHAKTILAAGAGPGKVTKYASQLCTTPEPKLINGVDYSYVYRVTGGRADYDGFGLVIPAGVLDSTTGQWVTITPQRTPTADLPGKAWPSADFSVLGAPWQDGGEQVYVTLPLDPTLMEFGSGYEPVIAHWSDATRSGGEEVSGGQLLVDQSAGTVTTAVTHLSMIDSIDRAVQWVSEPLLNVTADARFPAPSCDGEWSLDSRSGDWSNSSGARIHLDSAYLNLPGSPVPPLGYPIKHCVESGNGTAGTLRLLNNTQTIMSLTTYDGTTPNLGNVNIGGDPLALGIAKAAQTLLGHPVAYPGGEMTATVPIGTFNAVQMKPNVWLTALWATLDQSPFEDLLGKLPHVKAINDAVEASATCVMSSYGAAGIDTSSSPQQDADSIMGYITSCFTPNEFWQIVANGVKDGTISSDLANQVSSTLDAISRYSLWVRVGQVVLTGTDSLVNASGGSAGIVGISYYGPKPTLDAQGRPVQNKCITLHGYTYTLNQSCQDAFYYDASHPPAGSGGGTTGIPAGFILRDPGTGAALFYNSDAQTTQFIDDPGTYLCLAQRYVVDWAPLMPQYPGTILVSPSASCNSSMGGQRQLSPTTIGTNVILRQPDGAGWALFTLNGQLDRVSIPTPAEFMCWVSPQTDANIKFFVWDQVSDSELSQFPVAPAGTYVSNCGDPTNPGF